VGWVGGGEDEEGELDRVLPSLSPRKNGSNYQSRNACAPLTHALYDSEEEEEGEKEEEEEEGEEGELDRVLRFTIAIKQNLILILTQIVCAPRT